jgi:membrane-associated protein
MPDLLAYSGPAVCLLLLGMLVVESALFIGVFLPGDSLLFGAGLLVGSGRVDVPVAVLAASAWTGAVLGDSLGYGLGRWLGPAWLSGGRNARSRRFLAVAERMYERHGSFAIVICRWFPGVRAIVPTLAGVGRMHPVRFTVANGAGALLWAVGMVLLGYAAASAPWVGDLALWAMAVSIAVTVGYGLVHALRRWKDHRLRVEPRAGTLLPTGTSKSTAEGRGAG